MIDEPDDKQRKYFRKKNVLSKEPTNILCARKNKLNVPPKRGGISSLFERNESRRNPNGEIEPTDRTRDLRQ